MKMRSGVSSRADDKLSIPQPLVRILGVDDRPVMVRVRHGEREYGVPSHRLAWLAWTPPPLASRYPHIRAEAVLNETLRR